MRQSRIWMKISSYLIRVEGNWGNSKLKNQWMKIIIEDTGKAYKTDVEEQGRGKKMIRVANRVATCVGQRQ